MRKFLRSQLGLLTPPNSSVSPLTVYSGRHVKPSHTTLHYTIPSCISHPTTPYHTYVALPHSYIKPHHTKPYAVSHQTRPTKPYHTATLSHTTLLHRATPHHTTPRNTTAHTSQRSRSWRSLLSTNSDATRKSSTQVTVPPPHPWARQRGLCDIQIDSDTIDSLCVFHVTAGSWST